MHRKVALVPVVQASRGGKWIVPDYCTPNHPVTSSARGRTIVSADVIGREGDEVKRWRLQP